MPPLISSLVRSGPLSVDELWAWPVPVPGAPEPAAPDELGKSPYILRNEDIPPPLPAATAEAL